MKVVAEIPVFDHQLEFIQSKSKFTALIAGFGAGKSFAGVLRTMDLIKKRNGKALVLYVSPTFALAEDVNIPDFEEHFEMYKIPYKLNKTKHKIILTGTLKGQIWFRSGDIPKKIVGFDATDFMLDEFDILEPKQQDILWNKVIARIRGCKDSTGAITTTPEGFRKTYKLIHENKIGTVIKAKTTANTYLPEDYIETLYDQYDTKLISQYIDGEFVNINGAAAYYSFERNLHTQSFTVNSKQIYVGMDFNVNPMCAVFGVFYQNKLYIFDEASLKNSNTARMGEYIKQKFPDKDITICPDMTGIRKTTSSTLNKSDIDILTSFGFRIKGSSNPFVRDRLNACNNALSKDKIVIHSRCTELMIDLEQVVLDKYGEIDKSDPDRTHISDAMGYLIWQYYPIRSGRRAITRVDK